MDIFLLLLISILLLWWNNKNYPGIKTQDIIISAALFLCGMIYPSAVFEKLPTTMGRKELFIAEVIQKPLEKAKSFQSILCIKNKAFPKPKKVIAYFSKGKFNATINSGDQLIVFTELQEIKEKDNPFDLDYRSMMHNKGIYYSIYLSQGTYKKTGKQISRIIYWAERVRDKLIVLLNTTKIENNERAVISALTLGDRVELDRETMNCFVDTGTIHVLSVSGLHVALIFYILSLLFSPLNRGVSAVYIYPFVMIFCLWSYAFITGFSPSVQRSTVMFTFVIVGKMLRRPVNIYNSLTASALILILLEPNVLFDIGFQLSYLAVFGIVLLQPPLEKMLKVNNKFLKWGWTLFTVSIAAQLVTFPLSIFYFNQFPNLFWISNFIAIPGTTLIIWLTFLFFVISPLHGVAGLLAEFIQLITHQMLVLLKWLSGLPHAVTEGIVYSQVQTLILYGLLAAVLIYSFSKNKNWLFGGLILLIFFQTTRLLTNYQLFNQKIIFVYDSKSRIIHCINGRNSYILKNDTIPYKEQEIRLIQNICHRLKLKKPQFLKQQDANNLTVKDLAIGNTTINFLNCRINFKDPLTFNITGLDLAQFKSKNPRLLKNAGIQTGYPPGLIAEKKELFSISFSSQKKEAVCIFLN